MKLFSKIKARNGGEKGLCGVKLGSGQRCWLGWLRVRAHAAGDLALQPGPSPAHPAPTGARMQIKETD